MERVRIIKENTTSRHPRIKTMVSALVPVIALLLIAATFTVAKNKGPNQNANQENQSSIEQGSTTDNQAPTTDQGQQKNDPVVTKDSSGKPVSLVASRPNRVKISAINVNAPIVNLGLNKNGTVQVPTDPWAVGWYTKSATPGEMGPSVLIGHLDSATGPAVFWNLSRLKVGDKIEVTRGDGSTAVFSVTSTESVPQNSFPTNKVYGATGNAGLRLITCSGTWLSSQKRYSNNFIVYASLIDQYASK